MSEMQSAHETLTTKKVPGRKGGGLAYLWDNFGMLGVFAMLFLICWYIDPRFVSWLNMKSLGMSVSMVGMVACGMVFCLACGDLDLSVGSVVACAGMTTALAINATDSIMIGIIAGLATGAVFGAFNGFFVAFMKNNALIATLATMQIARGFAYKVTEGRSVGIGNDNFYVIGDSDIYGIPTPIFITIVCFIIFGFLLNQTVYGRNTLSIGGNEEAARLAGVNVRRTKVLIFTMSGIVAAAAGIVLTSRLTSGQPMNAMGLELSAISACVLGGVSLKGGVARMSTVIAGVLILGTVENIMSLRNLQFYDQYIVRGIILLAAINLDQYKHKLSFWART